jgi:DNA-binding MarR family transcriptional regulator
MDQQQILEQAIDMISRLMGQMEAEAFQQQGFSDLSMRQLLYLETIARMERPTFSELAAELGVTRPSVSGISQKLINMGYIKKEQSQEDRRVYRILLSAKGEKLNALHHTIHKLLAERLTQNLNESEIEQMAALLGKVVGG